MAATTEQFISIVYGGRQLEWTVVRRRKDRVEVQDHQQAGLEAPEGATTIAPEEWARQIRTRLGHGRGLISAALPTDQVLLRVTDLPSTDRDELAGMVDLQVDKFSPFPVEHMAVSFEVLHTHGTSSRVLIAAVRRDAVEAMADLFHEAGLRLKHIDVEVMGWWYLIRERGDIPTHGRHAMLILGPRSSELIISQAGIPVVIRSLGPAEDPESDEYASELAEETMYSLTSIESEWGGMETPHISVWHQEARPAKIIEKLRQVCEQEVQAHSIEDLPPLSEGLARRCMQDGRTLDLSLPEWHEAEKFKRARRNLAAATAAILLVWGTVMAALFLVSGYDRKRIDRLTSDIRQLEAPSAEVQDLRRRVQNLEQYADRTHSALECLREVTVNLPSGVDLTSFDYRKNRALTLRGEGNQVTLILDFIDALEKSELFIEVKTEGVTEAPGGRRRPEFRLTARLPGEEP